MKAVILAGGKGTRLTQQTQDIPKPMLPVGGKPMLEHQIELLKRYSITDIYILINYLGKVITDYFGKGEKWGVNIHYYEEVEPLGTVGGVKEIERFLDEDFIVLYGDVMVHMDLDRLISFHKQKQSECTLVVHPNNHPYDSDLVEMDDNCKVVNILSKNNKRPQYYSNMVNAGAYVFSPIIFKFLEKGKKADFGRDIFPDIFSKIKMFGYNTPEYLKDMGTPDRLDEVEKELLSGKVARLHFENQRSAIFLDRDGVINHEISFIHKPEDFKLFDFTAPAIKKINHSEYLAIVITNQSVIARNMCTLEELSVIHKKMETELGNERAKLDAIYFCPHHPDKGFPEERVEYKIDCECRKPKPGMLLQAAKDFNVDLKSSFMIGDSSRDIEAGQKAGCITIGVRAGHAMKGANVQPDYMFENLIEATNYIIDQPFKAIGEQVTNLDENANEGLYVIGVAGNTRSGKSTLAAYLTNLLGKENVIHIGLDNWLLPEEKRKHHYDVFRRFQLQKIEDDIETILKGKKVELQQYKIKKDQPESNIAYQLSGKRIVIIDGVVAFGSAKIREMMHLKLFVTTDIQNQKSRMEQYYSWRGKGKGYAHELLKLRKADEYDIIEKHATFADIVVKN